MPLACSIVRLRQRKSCGLFRRADAAQIQDNVVPVAVDSVLEGRVVHSARQRVRGSSCTAKGGVNVAAPVSCSDVSVGGDEELAHVDVADAR